MAQVVTTGAKRSPFLQRRFWCVISPLEMSVPMTGSGGIAKKPNLKALISSFYPLQQQQSGENRGWNRKESSGWEKTGSKSTAVASQLKILRVWRWNMLSPGSLNAVCSISLMAALPRSQTHVLSLQPAFCLQALLSVRGKRCPFTAGWPYKD